MKRTVAVLLCAALLLGACAGGTDTAESSGTLKVTPAGDYAVEYKNSDTVATVESGARHITFFDGGVTFDGTSSLATVNGTVVTVTAGGTYVVSGTCADGQIVVNEPKQETVRLVLDGLNLTCQSSAPICVQEAKKVVLVLAEGSDNRVTDVAQYTAADLESNEPNAAVFSKGDLSITGSGALTVTAQYNNGISSKDSLKITDGTLTVQAAGNGIKGKDLVAISGGTLHVTAGHDGIKSTNTADATAGFVRVDGGKITVTAEQDGIQAESGLLITDGVVNITSGGGSANASSQNGWGQWGGGDDSASAKALKAGMDIAVSGGRVTVDSSDDAVHSNGNVEIQGGTLSLTSGDDGIHADNTLYIGGGEVTVHRAYEGLEALGVGIGGGTVYVTASDDGINAAGGNDGSAMGRPGQNAFAATEGAAVEITGGYTVLCADGDGLDSNNTITMSGGTVLVYGPTNSANGAIDYAAGFTMNGGTLVACGAVGMAESITAGESRALFITCATQAAETPLCVTNEAGKALLTLVPPKTYGSAVIVTPTLKEGMTCTVTIGGSANGTVTDGVLIDGSCTAGETSGSITLSGVSTTLNLGSSGGFGGGHGGGFGGGQPPHGRP